MTFRNTFALTLGIALCASAAMAQPVSKPLEINTYPMNSEMREQIYSKPSKMGEITPDQVRGKTYFEPTQTLVSQKVNELATDLNNLQGKVAMLSANLNALQREGEGKAAEYYAAVATINTQLQSGTTPGNPRLLKRVSQAEASLENLGSSVATLNQLAAEAATTSSEASYLLEAVRAAYGLSGAIEEDHVRLSELEDAINNTVVIIERLLNNVNDDITRTTTYLSSERNNLRTLALAVTNGDLYGKSLSNRPFSSVATSYQASADSSVSATNLAGSSYAAQPRAASPLMGPRPLVKIKFDQTDVQYEEPVYVAVNEALQRYPDARFDLVAVHPTNGNAAEVAIESTRARRNAEKVLRTLTQMGLPLDRIDLSHKQSAEAASNEVHLYIR
jgi:outer membrane murein-binding lipoprotein Lpp